MMAKRTATRTAAAFSRFASLTVIFAIAAFIGTASPAVAEERLTITTGAPNGVYYAAGQALCDALSRRAPPVVCNTVASNGSTENLMRLQSGAAQFAIVQSDVQFDAVAGRGFFAATGADKSLRSVMSLHEEALAIIVRGADKARTVGELKGRSFSAGGFGTGTRETVEHLLDAAGWTAADRKNLTELPVETQLQELCAGKVDAIAYLVGHPARSIMVAAEKCAIRLLPIPENATATLTRRHPYHARTTIPGGFYRGNDAPIPTIAVHATVVTSAGTPEKVVQQFVLATVGRLTTLKETVEALSGVEAQRMGSAGLSAPLHPGAKKAFQQLSIPAAPAVKIPEAASKAAPVGVQQPKVDLTAPKPSVPAAPPAGASAATAQSPTSNPVGQSGRWSVERGAGSGGGPSLEADGAYEDAETSIQLKRALKK
jgi:TRAP transporter TAXI family solute receptor